MTSRVLTLVLSGMLDPSEHGVFQAIFGMIFTVLIALGPVSARLKSLRWIAIPCEPA